MTHAATKLIYKPGFFNIFQKLVFAESFSVPVGTPDIAAPSCIHWVTPILDAELNALVVTRGCYLEDASVAYPWGKMGCGNRENDNKPLSRFSS